MFCPAHFFLIHGFKRNTTSSIVILPSTSSIAESISPLTSFNTGPIAAPTGQRWLGRFGCREKTFVHSTARYTSSRLISAGLRARREPPVAPVCETTNLSSASSHNILLITTGFVFTLTAICSDLSGSSSDQAIKVKACTATAKRLLVDTTAKTSGLDVISFVTTLVTMPRFVKPAQGSLALLGCLEYQL